MLCLFHDNKHLFQLQMEIEIFALSQNSSAEF